MSFGRLLVSLARLLVVALAFVVGVPLGAVVGVLLGLPQPSAPEGTDQATLGLYLLLESPILALSLGLLSRGLRVGFLPRFLVLSLFTWIAYALNTYVEASIFTTYSAVSPFFLVMNLVACLLLGAAAAWAFGPEAEPERPGAAIRTFFAGRRAVEWAWRLALALASFPVVYLFFGSLVAPYTIEYYRQQAHGLTLPGWDKIVPVVFLRSLLFLLACLPVLIAWRGTARRLVITLGAALFVTVGLLYMLPAYWMPLSIRLLHSLEILADSFVYAGAVTILLGRPRATETKAGDPGRSRRRVVVASRASGGEASARRR